MALHHRPGMKKMIIGLLALLAIGSTAAAQTLPPNSVVGRLGIGPGPAQAVPFTTLGPLLFGSGSGVFGLTLSGDTNYTMVTTDRTVLINAAFTAPRTVTLPAASTILTGQQICLADAFGGVTSTNTLTIARAGSDTINGATSYVVNTTFGGVCLISNGSSRWSAIPQSIANAIYDVVATYGADPTGVADATTAINNAAAACHTGGGGIVRIRSGQYKIATTVSYSSTSFCKFIGDGPDNATGGTSGTRLVSSSATATILNITSSGGAYVEGIAFDSSVTRTGGAYLSVANIPNNNLIRNVSFSRYWIGLDLGWNNGTVDHALFWSPVPVNGTGISIHGNAGCNVLNDIEMFPPGPSNQPNVGILIGNSGCIQLSNSDIIQQGTNLLIAPGNGETASAIYVFNVFFDSGVVGVNIAPSGTGNVVRAQFVNTWASGNSNVGVGINRASGTVSGITFTNHHGINNTNHGLVVASGPVSALSVSRSLFANNGSHGIFVNAVVNGLDLSGNFSGAYGGIAGNGNTGIVLIAGQTDCTVIGNHLTGNGTALTDSTGCNNLMNLPAPAWTTFTPTPTCGTATFTVNSSRQIRVGKTVNVEADITFTALGTCTNTMLWNLPVTAQSATVLAGQDTTSGKAVACGIRAGALTQANCSVADVTNFTGTSRILIGGAYESQ